MGARWALLIMFLVAGLALVGCSGVAQPAGQGSPNDGWFLGLFSLVLVVILLIWWFLGGPEKEPAQPAVHAEAHGEKAHAVSGHAEEAQPAHGHGTEAGCVEFVEEPHTHAGGDAAAAHAVHEAPAPDENVCYPVTDSTPRPVGASAGPDDLKLIEGIGPKISGLLNAAGITTFAQLAATDVARLRQILADANLTRLADPGTWPEQARLAAAGDWDGLKALTDSLRGGRRA